MPCDCSKMCIRDSQGAGFPDSPQHAPSVWLRPHGGRRTAGDGRKTERDTGKDVYKRQVYALVMTAEVYKAVLGYIRYRQTKWLRNLAAEVR